MLSGQSATGLNTDRQHFGAGLHDGFDGPRLALVKQQAWMQVAVSGVEDVGDGDAVLLANLPDPAEYRG